MDGVIRNLFASIWKGVSALAWSPHFVRTVVAIQSVFPSIGDRRIKYRGTYMHATSIDRLVALLLWKYGIIEAYELEIARSLIRPGMQILDVGSNIGFHALEFARWAGPTGHVDAFEPAPENYAVLKRNVEASGLANVRAFDLAISNHTGEITLYLNPANRGDHRIAGSSAMRSAIRVPTTTLDERYGATGQRVDLVKIDVQGAEYLVLAGMRQVFRDNPDLIVLVEFSPGLIAASGNTADEFIDLLGTLNRRIQILDHRAKQCVDCDLVTLRSKASMVRQLDLLLTRNQLELLRGTVDES